MSARARGALGLALGIALGGVTLPRTASAGDRWPLWPTELSRVEDRIFDVGGSTEGDRLAAFERLHLYATPLVRDLAIRSVADPSAQIRKEALDLCALRPLKQCIPAALRAWNTGMDRGERMKALKVIALDPSEARGTVLFGALKDPDESMRRIAVQLVATAPFSADGIEEARRRLLAKLTDASAGVRGEAAIGLARLGGTDASLAVVRLLTDPDPSVRELAATALGRFADPRTRAALTRAIERGGTPTFVREAVNALASLPGEEVDAQLLALLDDPPDTSLSRKFVADAIGRRAEPSTALVDGLIERARVDAMRGDVLLALRRLGDAAVPRLEVARDRGLEPSLAAHVDDLLRTRDLPKKARAEAAPAPGADDRTGWQRLLRQRDDSLAEDPETDPASTDRAAVELATLHPAWLGSAVAAAVERAGAPRDARPWLIALAATPETVLDAKHDAWVWMHLTAWASDPRAPAEDRCLALAALGAASSTRHRKLVVRELERLPEARASLVRACAALSLGRLQAGESVLALLRDPVGEVRAAAALGAPGLRRPSPELRSTLATQALMDPIDGARTAATWAVGRLESGPAPVALVRAVAARRWEDAAGWLDLRGPDGTRLAVPVVGPNGSVPAPDVDAPQGSGRRWMLVPGLEGFIVESRDPYAEAGIVSAPH